MQTTDPSSRYTPIPLCDKQSSQVPGNDELSEFEIERVCRAFLQLVQSVKEKPQDEQTATEKQV